MEVLRIGRLGPGIPVETEIASLQIYRRERPSHVNIHTEAEKWR
jgi:hypothetical protein